MDRDFEAALARLAISLAELEHTQVGLGDSLIRSSKVCCSVLALLEQTIAGEISANCGGLESSMGSIEPSGHRLLRG